MEINSRGLRVVGFDCDGVMFDSKAANIAYYNQILAHLDLPAMTPEQVQYTHMHTVMESLTHLITDEDRLEAAHTYRLGMGYLPFIRHMEIEPFLKPLLANLRRRFSTAIATNRTDTMARVLEEHRLTDLFDLVVSALDVERPKPDPQQLYCILAHFDIQAHEMLYIGDSELDQRAADAAGVPFVAYDNPDLRAVAHISSLKQLDEMLMP